MQLELYDTVAIVYDEDNSAISEAWMDHKGVWKIFDKANRPIYAVESTAELIEWYRGQYKNLELL